MRWYWLTGPLVVTLSGWTMWLLAPTAHAREVFQWFAFTASVATLLLLVVFGFAALRRRG